MLRSLRGDKIITRAYEQANIGSIDNALTLLRRASRNSDPEGDRAEAMGMILYQADRWDEAADALVVALSKKPDDMGRLNYLCSALVRAEKSDLAMAKLDEYAAKHPADVAPHAIRCLVLADKQDFASASSAYQKAQSVFAGNHSQSSLSMGFLQQCADIVPSFPREPELKSPPQT